MGGVEGQAVGEGKAQRHAPAVGAGEVVGEEEVERIALVGGHGYAAAVDVDARVHQREAHPRVCSGYELAVELKVESGGVAAALLACVVDYLDVVHRVGNDVGQGLVVGLGGELIRPSAHAETVVEAGYEVYGALALDVAPQGGLRHAVDGRRVAQFLEERCLVVYARGEAQGHVVVESRHYAERHAGAYDALAVEVPVAEAYAVVQRKERVAAAAGEAPRVLYVCFKTIGVEPVARVERVYHVEVLPGVGYAVSA